MVRGAFSQVAASIPDREQAQQNDEDRQGSAPPRARAQSDGRAAIGGRVATEAVILGSPSSDRPDQS